MDGILCKGTYEELGLALYDILKEYGYENPAEETVDMLTNAYKNNANSGVVKPTCANLKEVLSKLKNEGRKLVIVTTDNYEITYKCLDEMGIKELFDAVFADDGTIPVKPDPSCILEYCKTNGISVDNAVMVGDTMTDIRFPRNAGMNVIGVGRTEKNKQRLIPYADFVVDDISYIYDIIEEYEK
jgi:HAD superfamily hydrolase (TIGR01549 family)